MVYLGNSFELDKLFLFNFHEHMLNQLTSSQCPEKRSQTSIVRFINSYNSNSFINSSRHGKNFFLNIKTKGCGQVETGHTLPIWT